LTDNRPIPPSDHPHFKTIFNLILNHVTKRHKREKIENAKGAVILRADEENKKKPSSCAIH
jgi:hypothetical protein